MRLVLAWGTSEQEVEVREKNLIPLHRPALTPPLTDVAAGVRKALEEPLGFPPLCRALTPDDQIAIAVDESLPRPERFLIPLLEYLSQARIDPSAVTLLCLPPSTGQPWLEELPDAFQEMRVEIHEPGSRKLLSYLATTRKGRRIYLNRTAVDADQLIVLSRLTYDPLLGVTAGEGILFPGLADAETRSDLLRHLCLEVPGARPWPVRQEAAEVAWLLGAPFLIQVVPGPGEEVAHVLGGPVANSGAAEALLNQRWRVEVDRPADVVVATITGASQSRTLLDLGRAFQAAARIVKPRGKIILLTQDKPSLGPAADLMRGQEEPSQALRRLSREKPADLEAAFLWASAAEQAHLYLLSGLPGEIVEEMFATPLEEASQVQRLLSADLSFIILPEAHQTAAILRNG